MRETIPGQILRAARELLGWSQRDLAEQAKCAVGTVGRAEAGSSLNEGNRRSIENALRDGGVVFVEPANGQGHFIGCARLDVERAVSERLKQKLQTGTKNPHD